MTPSLVVAVCALAALLTLWTLVLAARDVLVGRRFLQAMFALQAALMVQGAVVLVFVSDGERPESQSSFVLYGLLSLFLVPGSFALALEEKSRYGTLTFSLATAAVIVVETRMVATW